MVLAIIAFGVAIVVLWWVIGRLPINGRGVWGYGNPQDPRIWSTDFVDEPTLDPSLAEKWRERDDSPAGDDDKGWSS
jgi:hypothetical protein